MLFAVGKRRKVRFFDGVLGIFWPVAMRFLEKIDRGLDVVDALNA